MTTETGLSHVDFMDYGAFVSNNIFSYLGNNTLKQQCISNEIYEKIDEINRQFISSLGDYVDSYINYLLNPSSNTYFDTYQKNKSIAINNKDKLTQLSYSIGNNTSNMLLASSEKKNMISDEDKYYKKLLKKITNIKGSDNGSSLLINESVELYKSQYIDNSILIVGIIAFIVILYTMYK
jgi:hypothetical protein